MYWPKQESNRINKKGVGQIHRIEYAPNYGLNGNRTVYASSGYSGLWKSVDDGLNWKNCNTDNLPLTSVADIVINPNDTNNLFIATGLPDEGVTLEYASNWGDTNPLYTIGVYRSFDGGTTWVPINDGLLTEFYNKSGTIRELTIHPTNGNIIYAATSNGVYKCSNALSTDEFNPPVWEDISETLTGPYTDIRDVELKPGDPNTIYASSTDIFVSTTDGDSWSSLTGPATGLDFTIPNGFRAYRINMSVTPADQNRIFTYLYGTEGITQIVTYYIYYYNGFVWNKIIQPIGNPAKMAKEWIAIAASPVNPNSVFFYGDGIRGTNDCRVPNNVIEYGSYGEKGVYADAHVLTFQPHISENPKLFCGHHGGIGIGDISAPHQWEFRNNGLENMLLWSFDETKFKDGTFMIALQDTWVYKYANSEWTSAGNGIGGDSYTARSSNTTENLFYLSAGTSSFTRFDVLQNTEQGESSTNPSDWVTGEKTMVPHTFPVINFTNDHDDYFGLCEIYRRKLDLAIGHVTSDDIWERDSDVGHVQEPLFARQITEFDYCLNYPDYCYLATGGDYNGGSTGNTQPLLMKSNIGGNNGNYNIHAYFKLDYPGIDQDDFPMISGIACDPNDSTRLWITLIGYDNIDIRVALSEDGGRSWSNADLNNSLPELPINGIVYQNGSNDVLYIATDAGIYYKDASMDHWEEYGNFPHVRVHELKINYCNNKLTAATYGRSLWEGDLLPSSIDQIFYEVKEGENITWEKAKPLRSSVKIKNGGVLTIKNNVNMPKDSKIIVEPGGKLYIDGGTLTNECGYTWEGIEVWGNSHEHQWPDANGHYAQGYVNLDHATIKNAICALNLMKPGDYGTTGGIVYASNSNFVNNTQSVHATSYTNFHPVTGKEMDYQAKFDYCNFELNPDYISSQEFSAHVELSSLKGVRFDACNFMLSPDAPNVNNHNHGISSSSASFSVNAVCNSQQSPCPENSYDKCTFNGFYYGISANVIDEAFTGFYVNRADFTNNTHGVFVNGINNYIVIKSNFYIGRNKCDNIFCTTSPGYGVYSSGAHGFSIEENTFVKAPDVISTYLVGILIENTDNTDVIYKNTFDGLSYGNIAKLDNILNTDIYNGLSYLCNYNTNNYADFFTPDNSQVEIYQGDRTLAAGNTFSTNARWHFYNNGVYDPLDYFYCPNCIYEIPDLTKINKVRRISAPANTCPSHYTEDVKLTEEQKLTLETEFAEETIEYNSVSTLYSELEDGGNTESKLTQVSSATTNNMLIIKQDLLGTSPHLSESVLKAVSDKTEVFPDAAIFDILAANPDEMKNSKLIKHLQEKQNPLPQYMIDILKQISEGSTYKSVIQQDMARHGRKKSNAAMDQIRSIINDTIIDYNELRNWLDNLGGIEADMQIIETYMHQKNYNAANSLAQTLPSIYSLEGKGLEEYGMYMSLLNLEQELDSTRTYADLTDTEFALLQSIADSSEGKAGAKAKGIIRKYYGGHFYDCINLDENSYKSSPVNPNVLGEVYGLNITCNPNPAREWTTFDFTLPENQKSATLSVFDNSGRIVFNKQLNGQNGQYIWDTKKIEACQYVYIIHCAGFNKSGKITVIK